MSEPKYKVRPSSRTDPKDVFRVFLSPAQLLLHKLRAGDVCNIETPHGLVRPALVWPSTEKIKDDVVQTSKPLQILYGLKLDNRVSITRSDLIVLEARDIILSEDGQDESEHPISSLDERGRTCWAWLLEYILSEAEILAPGMVFDRLEAKGERRSFRIISINYINASALFHASPDCKIHIINQLSESLQTRKPETRSTTISSDGVGGLDRQLKQLNERMATYLEARRSRDRFVMPSYYRPRRGGVLLHGSSGTGKSMLLNKISEAGWRNVLRIDKMTISHRAGEIEAVIHQVFSEALRSQPSVILIDGLDFIAGKNSAEQLGRVTGVGQILCNELGRIVNTHTLVVGATRKLSDIEQDLRLSGRFEFEIEIPIPDSKSRAEILKVLSGFLKHEAHTVLDSLAARTHAFVGADLQRLLERAVEIAAEEAETQFLTGRSSGESSESCLGEGGKILIEASEQDFDKALLEIRPTAMQEIFVETPNVCWDDIGGQGEVKKRLEQAIVWPFKVSFSLQDLTCQILTLYSIPMK